MYTVTHLEDTIQTVSENARYILFDCPWQTTPNNIFQSDADDPRVRDSVDMSDWINVMKVSGGTLGIAWYHHNKDMIVEFTIRNTVSDSNNPLQKVIVEQCNDSNTLDVPAYRTSGHQYIRDNLDSEHLSPACVTIAEIRDSLPVDAQPEFPLEFTTKRPVNMFTHDYSPGIAFECITEFIPVTDPAKQVISNMPWTKPRDDFLSYASSNNPDTFRPAAQKWMQLMRGTAGQIITAWYDPRKDSIDQVTYYDLDDTNSFKCFTLHTEMAYKTNATEFAETIVQSRLNPIAMSIHSRDTSEFL